MRRTRRNPLSRPLLVAAILLAALALRVAFVQTTSYHAVNDASTYNRLSSMVAHHGDYHTGTGPHTGAGESRGPTAYFPPAFPYLLAAVKLLDGHTAPNASAWHGERLAGAVLGTVAVGLIGLVALEAFGPGPGLAALVIAAIYPVLIELSATIVAENLLIVFELAATWTALRARRSGRPWRWIAATGILAGLATLAHENAALMVIALAFAVASVVGGRARRRIGAVALLLGATAAMIAPWTIRNAIELHHFVPVSDETGITLRGAYNPASAAFAPLPYKWRYFAQIPQDAHLAAHAGRLKELTLGARLEHRALRYIAAHPTAPLTAGETNLRRMFELAGTYAWHASARAIGLHVSDAAVGVVAFWVLCLLAISGLFTNAARAGPRWIWAIPVLFALSVLFINVETPRFREPIDPFIVLLAACAVSAAVARVRRARARSSRGSTSLP